MTSLEEKTPAATNVLTIGPTRPKPTRQTSDQSFEVLSTIDDVSSQHSLTHTRTAHSEESAIMAPPYPFSESKTQIVEQTSSNFTDLEQGISHSPRHTDTGCRVLSKDAGGGADPWPGVNTLKRQRKEQKRSRAFCTCWGGLGKKQKLGVKIGAGFLVTIITIFMCVFISKAVGGGVWDSHNSNAPIPSIQ